MFYNHTILTQRKYGVATVWLVATLGSKSSISKRLQKKDIMEVDLPKACESIMHSDTPLALRLQSNLLYGVSRVFKEQYQYFYADVANAHTKLNKDMFELHLSSITIGLPTGKRSTDALLLQNDPAFTPEISFTFAPGILEDLANPYMDQDLVSQDKLSMRQRSRSHSVSLADDASRLIDDRSPHNSVTGSFSSGGPGGFGLPAYDDDDFRAPEVGDNILQQPDIEFDEDGNIRDFVPIRSASGAYVDPFALKDDLTDAGPKQRKRWDSESIASDRLRREHAEDFPNIEFDNINPFDPVVDPYAEDEDLNTALIPPPKDPNSPGMSQDNLQNEGVESMILNNASTPVQAPKRRARRLRKLKRDDAIELRGSEILKQRDGYLEEQATIRKKMKTRKQALNAKLYAQEAIFGWGGKLKPKELAVTFAHDNVVKLLQIGGAGGPKTPKMKKSKKRVSMANEDEEIDDAGSPSGRRVKPDFMGRHGDDIGPEGARNGFDLNNFNDDGNIGTNFEDDALEIGRRATPQQDSRIMPWNLPSRSSRAGSVFSLGGGFGFSSLPGSALQVRSPGMGSAGHLSARKGFRISASPAPGKPRLDKVNSSFMQNIDGEDGFLTPPLVDGTGIMLNEQEEFEYFGAGAKLETQGATQSWISTLEQEGFNFLEFVKAQIERENEGIEDEAGETNATTFDELIEPDFNTSIVAAHALLHTLLLATRGLVRLNQQESFGEIRIKLA